MDSSNFPYVLDPVGYVRMLGLFRVDLLLVCFFSSLRTSREIKIIHLLYCIGLYITSRFYSGQGSKIV